MKIKNLTFFSLAVAVLCVAARTVTLLYATQSDTGFFIARLAPLGICLSVGIFLLILVAAVFAFSAKEKAHSPFKLSRLSALAAIVLGVFILLYSFGFNAHSYLIAWQHTLEAVSGILAGCWFILYGMSAFINIKLPKITAILPCIHSVMRLVVVFTSLSTSALVAEHVFSLAYHVSVMVYMLNLGRMAAEEPAKNSQKTFFPLTVVSFIFTCTSTFSRLIALLLNKENFIHSEVPLDITGIVLCIFMLLIAADICKANKEETKEADLNDIQC